MATFPVPNGCMDIEQYDADITYIHEVLAGITYPDGRMEEPLYYLREEYKERDAADFYIMKGMQLCKSIIKN